jgi:glycosyltransferase involved in cell wall biosynthesis
MDEGSLPWAHRVTNQWRRVRGVDLLWQPLPRGLRIADLLILMQENRILSNYPLLLSRRWRKGRLGYWGHGANLQSRNPRGLRERWKRFLLRRVDWWFGYTEATTRLLCEAGFPADRITCLNNATDTRGFREAVEGISPEALAAARRRWSLSESAAVGLFCGSLYPDKRLDLLISASDYIRARIPSFTLLILGDGPSRPLLECASRTRPWVHWAGVQRGGEKAIFYRLAHVVLNPGAVGLHVLDACAAGLPLLSTASALHGPEVAYLEPGLNGLLEGDTPEGFGAAVVALLQDPRRRETMSSAALAAASRFSLEEMVRRFVAGIQACLGAPKRKTWRGTPMNGSRGKNHQRGSHAVDHQNGGRP